MELDNNPSVVLQDYVKDSELLCSEKRLKFENIKIRISTKSYLNVIKDLESRMGNVTTSIPFKKILTKFGGASIEIDKSLKEEIGAIIIYEE